MNMATFARQECEVFPEEREYAKWLRKLCGIVGNQDDDGWAWGLFLDGCSPEEAAEELT